MRNFTGLGVFPATNRICITQVAPQEISLDSSTQLPVMAGFAGPPSSPLIIINRLSIDQGTVCAPGTGVSTKTLLTKTLPMRNTTQPKT